MNKNTDFYYGNSKELINTIIKEKLLKIRGFKFMKNGKQISHKDLDGAGAVIVASEYLDIKNVVYASYSDIDSKVLNAIEELKKGLYSYLLITDISPSEKIIKAIDEANKSGLNIMLVDHKTSIKLGINDYDWAICEVERDGMLTSATNLLLELLKTWDLEFLSVFAEKVRRYDTWDWTRLNDETSRDLNTLFWIIGEKEFERKFKAKAKMKDGALILDDYEKKYYKVRK